MSAEMQQATEDDPITTPVSALTNIFANMKVAENHKADNLMQSNADGSSTSGTTASQTVERTSRSIGKQKKHPHLAVTPPRITDSDDGYKSTQTARQRSPVYRTNPTTLRCRRRNCW